MGRFFISLAIVLAVLAIFLPGVFRSKKLFDVNPVIGNAPPNFNLIEANFEGKDRTKKQLSEIVSEDNIVIINFFASWCNECSHERRTLLKLKDKAKIIGVVFGDKEKNIEDYLKELNPYDYISFDNGEIAVEYGVTGVPETFVVVKGKIVKKFVGPVKIGEITMLVEQR